MPHTTTHRISLICLAVLGLVATSLIAGEKVYVGQRVSTNRQVSMDRINHRPWDALLKKYCDQIGDVNYGAWKRSAQDMAALDQYLNHLSYANPGTQAASSAQLAFWINAYNAVTVRGILREYPTTSIRNHTSRLFGYNIWKELLLHVGGTAYSLEQIEHQILREMREPRIHFAIVCASRSCPRLRREAYLPTTLDQQLTANAIDFFASPRNFRYDGRSMQLSTILKWFATDFGADRAAQLKYVAPYLPSAAARQAAQTGTVSVTYLDYDWGLNDQSTASGR